MLKVIRKLTKSEEQEIIDKYIKNENYIDAGSSRAVFHGEEGQVIKVALDEGGRTQNKHELEFYAEHGDNGYFGKIYAYGEFVIVMEYVDVTEDQCLIDYFWRYFEDSDQSSELEDWFYDEYTSLDWYSNEDQKERERIQYLYDEIYQIFYFLGVELGNWTSDNAQIGLTGDGWKLYDYGYNVSSPRRTQIGSIHDAIDYGVDVAYEIRHQLLDDDFMWKHTVKMEEI